MSVIELVQVVDITAVAFDIDLQEELAVAFEASNDSYHRYYPHESWTHIDEETKQTLNEVLLGVGVVFPDVLYRPPKHPDGYYNFYVLLNISW